MSLKVVLYVLCFLFSIHLFSQKNIINQDLLWTKYILNVQVHDKWTPFFDVEERVYISPLRQHQFLPNLGVHYKLDDQFSITSSIMYFELTIPQDPNADFEEIIRELRPQIALNFKYKLKEKWSFVSRFKAEWRYFRFPAEDTYKFRNYRFRMRMGLKYKFNNKWDANLLEEIHINAGEQIVNNTFDQNRLSAGINYNFNKNFSLETGYLYWFQQRASGKDFFSRDIFYFTLKHNVKWNNK